MSPFSSCHGEQCRLSIVVCHGKQCHLSVVVCHDEQCHLSVVVCHGEQCHLSVVVCHGEQCRLSVVVCHGEQCRLSIVVCHGEQCRLSVVVCHGEQCRLSVVVCRIVASGVVAVRRKRLGLHRTNCGSVGCSWNIAFTVPDIVMWFNPKRCVIFVCSLLLLFYVSAMHRILITLYVFSWNMARSPVCGVTWDTFRFTSLPSVLPPTPWRYSYRKVCDTAFDPSSS